MTRKLRYGMSLQSRSGGGGLMHTSGYDGAHSPIAGGGGGGGAGGGGGGDAGGGDVARHVKPSTGCSSIAFPATPVWPWSKSKKATPVTVALEQTWTLARARLICRRRARVARAVHEDDGASAIIVLPCPSSST